MRFTKRGVAVAVIFGMGSLSAVGAANLSPASAIGNCVAPAPLQFDAPKIIDTTRAGGEPMIATAPNGNVLVGTHAGTTHIYAPGAASATSAAFAENYRGQTYYYWSNNEGKTFTFVPRDPPGNGNLLLSGFSDPDLAFDTAGAVYVSEINLVNVAMSKSTDGGKSYALTNLLAETLTDRQWSEADQPGVVYLVGNASGGGTGTKSIGANGHILYKTKDSGANFNIQVPDGGGLGDLRVDKSDGTLYETHYDGDALSMAAFRNARKDDLKPEINTIAKGVDMKSHWPAFDLDRLGNVYVTWDETGRGAAKRPAGVYYAYSRTRGKTWSAPVRVDTDPRTDIWPWISVGEPGKVAIAYLEADIAIPGDNAETSGTHGWRVAMAHTFTGLGCGGSADPGFASTIAIKNAMHTGTVCMGGTACEASQTDRRMGDYFSVAIDGAGHVDAMYTDTQTGGIIGLPTFLHQSGGPTFGPPAIVTGFGSAGEPTVAGATVTQAPAPATNVRGARLPATGRGTTMALVALLILGAGASLRLVIRRKPARL
jgi:hypothetical protein